MGFNLGKIFRTIVNPLVGRATPAAQSAAYQAQGMAAANQVATQINNDAATQNAASAQQAAVRQQQATQNQLQADNLAAADESLRNAARVASKGSTANVLYGSNYNRKDEKTSSVLLGG